MSYQTGNTTSPVDLLQKLVTFLQAAGWTANANESSGTGHWKAHLQKDAFYVNLFASIGMGTGYNPWAYSLESGITATSGCMFLYLGDGYTSGLDWRYQPGGPTITGGATKTGVAMKLQDTGLGSYHFFANADAVVIYVERVPGLWVSMGWGNLQKAGSFTGGQFFFSNISPGWVYSSLFPGAGNDQSAWAPCQNGAGYSGYASCTFVRADVDSFTGKWIGVGGSNSGNNTPYNCTGKLGASSAYGYNTPPNTIAGNNGVVQRAQSSVTGQLTLLPIRLFVARDAAVGAGYSLVGTVPDCFEARHSYAGGKEISIGADTYVIFPNCAIRKVA